MRTFDLGAVTAYAIAVKNGFQGTEAEWLESLKPKAQPDWNQNDPTQPDYVQNRTHWAEYNTTVLFPETVLTADDEGLARLPAFVPLEHGGEYTVKYNGEEYVCTANEMAMDSQTTACLLGNYGALMGGASTGEPFVIMALSEADAQTQGANGVVLLEDPEATISIYLKDEVVHKLDNKYLDLEWLPIEVDGEVLLVDEYTADNFYTTSNNFPLTGSMVNEGDVLVFYIDGERCVGVVQSTGEGGFLFPIPYAGENVLVTMVQNRTVIGIKGEHTVSVYRVDKVLNKLPEEYLPDTVGKVKTVNGISPDENGNVEIATLPDDAEQLEMLIEADMLPAVHDADGKILTDENGNVILRY